MADKNNDESVRDANPHDLREHFEFSHAIAIAMGNNCPTAEWHSWKDVPGKRDCSAKFKSWKKVPEELKKSMLGELTVHWDIDETDEKQWIYVDGLFKQRFR
ncbi:hypothetical protein C1H46_025318 [Malus baccata]|uniref:Uncharacterized protein n=1 Tax=Malus baccata TaxID=106549 RepID=A0A540LS52_MALBA|nr:hypothetical protein C1H46_025318 [Malus baccata]